MAPQQPRPTDSELDILSVIWQLGEATVRHVHTELNKSRETGYTSVLKLMQIMTDKGLLVRDESQRSHIYRARQRETSTQKQLVKDLMVRAFGGSPEKLVMQALSAKRAKPEEIAEIRRMLDELEGDQS